MSMFRDVLAQHERYDDLLREAERDRLVLHGLALPGRRNRFHCRVMTWLGQRLISWGFRLQERYGVVPLGGEARASKPRRVS